MASDKADGIAALIAVAIVVFVITVLTIVRGYILSYLWEWFITPLGVMSISISHAIGISMIVAYLTYEGAKKEHEAWVQLGVSLIAAFVVFGVGWLVHTIMVG